VAVIAASFLAAALAVEAATQTSLIVFLSVVIQSRQAGFQL
jgi:hypothetical protein